MMVVRIALPPVTVPADTFAHCTHGPAGDPVIDER